MERPSLPTRFLDELFSRLHAILGVKFADMFNGADTEKVREEWGAALVDFKPVELDRGIADISTRRFVPTLGEFKNMCRPCLDPEWAYREAEKCLRQRDVGHVGEWTHPAVWRAASALSMEVRKGDYAACRTRWAYVLKDELAKGWGEYPPEPPLRISSDVKGSATSEVAMRERRKIAELLGRVKREGDDASNA